MTLAGEMGYATALSAPKWGFSHVHFNDRSIELAQPLSSYVMENVLFKISFPAEFHAQTAVEAAIELHPHVRDHLESIHQICIETQEPAVRIIDKKGLLTNPADRDHCLQYMIAIGLIHGMLTADHYEDEEAADPRIDMLRETMKVVENTRYSRDYADPNKRSIANAVQVFFKDGSETPRIEVEYPIGHRRRRDEGLPLLMEKFKRNLATRLAVEQCNAVLRVFADPEQFDLMPVRDFVSLLVTA